MIVYLLTLIFYDGHMGGQAPFAEYPTMDTCQQQGAIWVTRYNQMGHPSSFFCTRSTKRPPGENKTIPPEDHKYFPMPAPLTPN